MATSSQGSLHSSRGSTPQERIRSNETEDFLDSKKATSRRRNNLRSEIITLFRYAQIRLRALHRDRKTEAELVLRDQTKRKPVETFSPKEFRKFDGPLVLPFDYHLSSDEAAKDTAKIDGAAFVKIPKRCRASAWGRNAIVHSLSFPNLTDFAVKRSNP
jgi:hypothetical protein